MAEEPIGPDGDHFVVEVSVKQVSWKLSKASAAGSGRTVDGPPVRQTVTLTKHISSASELEAAVGKAMRVLAIEIGQEDDA